MKILIISGFLGAGKTTFIKEMIRATKRDFVIFENEFADVSVDGDILKQVEDEDTTQELTVWEFTDGCVCCGMQGDFTNSLIVISNSLNPDFLIVEPSGVGVLSAIIQSVRKVEYQRIQLLAPITIIDAQTFWQNRSKFADLMHDQIRHAKHIQLSKTEQLSSEELHSIEEAIRQLNAQAVIYTQHYRNQKLNYWNQLFDGELVENVHASTIDLQFEHMSVKKTRCQHVGEFITFLEYLVRGLYGNISRAKGVFQVQDYLLRFDVVNEQYAITIAEDDAVPQAVFIGENLNRLLLKATLTTLRSPKIVINIKTN